MKCCILLICASIALSNALAPQRNRNYFGQQALPTPIPQHTYNKKISNGEEVFTLRNENEINPDGSYHYAYETSNGIAGSESGVGGVAVQGSSSYISPEGIEIRLSYTADENGYHPVGDHIPKTPDYVYRALEYIRTHSEQKSDSVPPPRKAVTRPPPAPVARKIVPATRKPTPVTRKPTVGTRKPAVVKRKPAVVTPRTTTRKPKPTVRKTTPAAYKKPIVAQARRNQKTPNNRKY